MSSAEIVLFMLSLFVTAKLDKPRAWCDETVRSGRPGSTDGERALSFKRRDVMRLFSSIHVPHFQHFSSRSALGSVRDQLSTNYGVVMITLAILVGLAIAWIYWFGVAQ